MFKVLLQESAKKTLDILHETDSKTFQRVIDGLDDLEKNGLKSSSIKRLSNSESIFRKRVGRYRILFTLIARKIDIWVIEMEKDTKKDYKRWLKYIKKYN